MSREVHVRFCEGVGVRLPRATHLVIGFERADDARRVMRVLAKRFAKFGLTIHPEKTRLLRFMPPGLRGEASESFDFLGFTHYWGKSLKGNWTIKRRTSKKRQNRAMTRIRHGVGKTCTNRWKSSGTPS